MFDRDTFYCPNCGTIDHPMTITRGSFWVEVMLWLFFLVPGLIYSVWRLSTPIRRLPRLRIQGHHSA